MRASARPTNSKVPAFGARSSALAVRKNFASASGNTTVPMSRPSTTTPPSAPMRRCSPSRAARTSGSADTRDAPSEISGARIAAVTSFPFSVTWLTVPSNRNAMSMPSASAATPGPSSQATPRSRARSAIDR